MVNMVTKQIILLDELHYLFDYKYIIAHKRYISCSKFKYFYIFIHFVKYYQIIYYNVYIFRVKIANKI
jgi:hypothetical protein